MKMNLNLKRKKFLWLFPIILFTMITIFSFRNNYLLNRTLTEIALRLTQIEILSRTTGIDYKLVFLEDRYAIDNFDNNTGKWCNLMEKKYLGRVSCSKEVDKIEFIFSQGKFWKYQSIKNKDYKSQYIIIEFSDSKAQKKRRIIFYKKGSWKVLG